jgi:hypothetical protein
VLGHQRSEAGIAVVHLFATPTVEPKPPGSERRLVVGAGRNKKAWEGVARPEVVNGPLDDVDVGVANHPTYPPELSASREHPHGLERGNRDREVGDRVLNVGFLEGHDIQVASCESSSAGIRHRPAFVLGGPSDESRVSASVELSPPLAQPEVRSATAKAEPAMKWRRVIGRSTMPHSLVWRDRTATLLEQYGEIAPGLPGSQHGDVGGDVGHGEVDRVQR